jgi:enterochelin esterase-like enzyme
MIVRSLMSAGAIATCATLVALWVVGSSPGSSIRPGTLTTGSAPSAALGEAISFNVYLPDGYDTSALRYPTLYLLHGRGDSMEAWTRVKSDLDTLIGSGAIPPVVVVMPDAPWSGSGNWYVDSQYTGADYPGRPVETALTHDLVGYVDSHYRTVADRAARAVGGYSMGGSGALRYVLAHQDVFSAGLILSPAVYTPLPPSDSSTRDYGAFGQGSVKFVDSIYEALNYPASLATFNADLPVHLFIAVGDDEYVNPNPVDARHDLDFESAVLYNAAKRVPGITAEFRELNGGHDWDVWQPGFDEGVQDLFKYLSTTAPVPLTGTLLGTSGDDRAGGVAADPSGDTVVGLAAAGSVNGQPYAGGTDAVVTRRTSSGTTVWTREFGTTSTERPYGVVRGSAGEFYAAGYTHGNLDANHAGNATDDMFVARIDSDGTLAWVKQFGDPAAADRVYAIVANPSGGVYVGGYTKGSVGGGTNAGDKDAVVASVSANGQVSWVDELGGTGEDKTFALTVGSDGSLYAAGVASAAMPGATAAGGLDGWLAKFGPDGTRAWLHEVGTAQDDQLAGLATAPSGDIVATGDTAGDLAGANAGARDVTVLTVSPAGKVGWTRQLGTPGDERGADVTVRPDGEIVVAAFTNGKFAAPSGGTDVAMLRLSPKGKLDSATQFGTAQTDGADTFAEENLYLTGGAGLWLTGLTYGSLPGQPSAGPGDVFLTALDPATGNPSP